MVTATLTLPQKTIDSLEQVAAQRGITSSELADNAIRQYLRREAEKKIAQEETAYQDQHEQIFSQFEGRYVALHNGEVIDHDQNELDLYLRIRHAYPSLGILIKHVTNQIDEIWQTRSPRIENI